MMRKLRSPIIRKLFLWFSVLSLIPIVVVLIFVQTQVRNTYINLKLNEVQDDLRIVTAQINSNPALTQEKVSLFAAQKGGTAFIMDRSGSYLFHSTPQFIGQPASADYSDDIVDQLLAEPNAYINDRTFGQIMTSSPVGENIMVVVLDSQAVFGVPLNDLSRSITIQLFISLAIAAVIGGTGIISVLGPMEELSELANQAGSGDLDVEFKGLNLEGELAILAWSFNNMVRNVKTSIANLENRVNQRTTELNKANDQIRKRAAQFETVIRVSRIINTAANLQSLLPQIANLISDQFGFYHTGIFLNDSANEYAILSAVSSEGGKLMMARKHRLKIGEQGIVGYVTGTGRPRIALDVGEDAVYFNNPELPLTHSEMALPLKTGDRIIGALDIQSTEANAFSSEDVEILTYLADQVSMAIQNAILFDQNQKALAEAEAIQRQYLRETWSKLPQEQQLAGFKYTITGVTPLEDIDSSPEETNQDAYQVPIALRGEEIGTLSVKMPQQTRFSQDQIDLIKAVAERVALSAENARLFEETSSRASREQKVTEITTKIRTTNDPEEMIRTAVEELQRALGVSHVEIVPQKATLPPDR